MGRRDLPDHLVEQLSQLERDLARGRGNSALARKIETALHGLPAKAVFLAEGRLWRHAGLYCYDVVRRRRWLWFLPWSSHLDRLAKDPSLALPFLFHRNGHVREAALRAIARRRPSAFGLAAVFYRLNDWVAQVRDAAARAARELSDAAPADATAAAALAAIVRLDEWGRLGANRDLFCDILDRNEVSAALAAILLAERQGPMGSTLRLLLSRPTLDGRLPELAAKARVAGVRAVAADALVFGRARWPAGWRRGAAGSYRRERVFAERALTASTPLGPILLQASRDKAAVVRKVAADGLIANLADAGTASAIIETLRDDRNNGVRERIAFVVRQAQKA